MHFTIRLDDLRDGLALNACAAADTALTVLTGVNLTTTTGGLIATATDRYWLGSRRIPAEGAEPGASITISAASARHALTVFTSPRRGLPSPTLGVVLTPGEHITFNGPAGTSLTPTQVVLPAIPGEYPKVGKVMRDMGGHQVAITVDTLTGIAKLARARRAYSVHITIPETPSGSGTRALLFQFGSDDSFVGFVQSTHQHDRPGFPAFVAELGQGEGQ